MARIIPIAAAAILAASAAVADRMVIDDDRWSMEGDSASTGFVVDIDDDGWTRQEMPASGGTRVDIDDDGWTYVGDTPVTRDATRPACADTVEAANAQGVPLC